MADMFAVAGAKIFIGASRAAPTADMIASDFSAVSWTQIKEWQTCGAFGDGAALITTQIIDRARDVKQKGTRNAGSMQNTFAINTSDPGQLALIAAEKTRFNYPFKIEWDDEPSGGTPSLDYFVGIVMSAQQAGGGPNTVRSLNSTIEINSNIVNVPASA